VSNADLWAGQFGDDYTARCDKDYSPRHKFWGDIIYKAKIRTVLEVGCNTGQNIDIISDYLPSRSNAWGCDVNQKALDLLHERHKELNAVKCSGFDLPFRDEYFDMVFTAGVLIHQQPSEIDIMMQEIIRVSHRYVLCMEYYSDIFEEVPYRGKESALFKGPYGDVYEKKYGLKLIDTGFMGKGEGFDDLTWHLLSRR
jgi:pseudaminic acid biosynthesis-associated methylase